MSVRNKLSKAFFYVGLAVYTTVLHDIMGCLLASVLVFPVLAVWSAIKPLPLFVTQKLWLIYLLSGVATGTILLLRSLLDVLKSRLKQNKKQDNSK